MSEELKPLEIAGDGSIVRDGRNICKVGWDIDDCVELTVHFVKSWNTRAEASKVLTVERNCRTCIYSDDNQDSCNHTKGKLECKLGHALQYAFHEPIAALELSLSGTCQIKTFSIILNNTLDNLS